MSHQKAEGLLLDVAVNPLVAPPLPVMSISSVSSVSAIDVLNGWPKKRNARLPGMYFSIVTLPLM